MTAQWKPEGYSTVSPYLVVDGAARVIEFLREVFGATPARRYENPDGSIMHAEVRIGDTIVMLGDAGGEWGPTPGNLHVYVEDADAIFRRAIDAGAEPVREPTRNGDDPDRRGGFKDPGGNTWWVATQEE